MKAVLDSVILIDHLNGIPAATAELTRYEELSMSVVAWIEVLTGAASDEEHEAAQAALVGVDIVDVDRQIALLAIPIRRERRLKLPDAIILATARHLGCPLVTRNTKDFDPADPSVLVPYEV